MRVEGNLVRLRQRALDEGQRVVQSLSEAGGDVSRIMSPVGSANLTMEPWCLEGPETDT